MIENTINIDCYGRSYTQDITVQAFGQSYRFIYDERKKTGLRFTAGLFLDRALLHQRCLYRFPAGRRVVVLLESPNEPHFGLAQEIEDSVSVILTHDAELLNRKTNYQRFDYGMSWFNDGTPLQVDKKTRLASFVGSLNHPDVFGYQLRKAVANHFIPDERVDCFGKGIREVESKQTALEPYCFSIAMENARKD